LGLIQLSDKRSICRRICDGISLISGYCLVAVKAPIGNDLSQDPSSRRTPCQYLLKLSFSIIEKEGSPYADLHLTQLPETGGLRQTNRVVPAPLSQEAWEEDQEKEKCPEDGFPESLRTMERSESHS
jgi:hypothetical protein